MYLHLNRYSNLNFNNIMKTFRQIKLIILKVHGLVDSVVDLEDHIYFLLVFEIVIQ